MNVDLAGHRLDLTISTFPYLGRVDSPQQELCVAANVRSPEERSRNKTGQIARRCRSAFATCQNFGCKAASSHFPPTGDIHNNAAICQNGDGLAMSQVFAPSWEHDRFPSRSSKASPSSINFGAARSNRYGHVSRRPICPGGGCTHP